MDKLVKYQTPEYDKEPSHGINLSAKLAKYRELCLRAENDCFTSRKKLKALKGKVTALSYRLGELRGGENKLEFPDQPIDDLLAKAARWKKKQICFGDNAHLTDEEALDLLTDADKEQIYQLACYPSILPFIKMEDFCSWAIRNERSVDIFVQFPSLIKKMSRCLMSSRLIFGGLELVENNGSKDVVRKMGGNPVSILNPKQKVVFKTGYSTTVKEIFNGYKNKNLEEGHFTAFKDEGDVAYDPNLMADLQEDGSVTPIDVVTDKQNWYKQLRMKEVLTAEEATERFGMICDGQNWVLTLVCARQKKEMDTFGSHGFLRMAIPREDGHYDCTYGFGKFSKIYPQNPLHNATFLFCPKDGTLQYPDNNEIYTNREKKEIHYSLTAEEGGNCLESIRQDIEDSQNNKLVFQILRWNCSDWAVKKIRKFVGADAASLMDVSYLDLEPSGFFGTLLKVLRVMPDCIRRGTLHVLGFLFGSWTWKTVTKVDGTKKTYQVMTSPPWSEERQNRFHHPGKPFKLLEAVDS